MQGMSLEREQFYRKDSNEEEKDKIFMGYFASLSLSIASNWKGFEAIVA
jgi:hypothetical protein